MTAPRYVLAIDPGVTIGIAMIDGRTIIETAAIDTRSEDWETSLRAWLMSYGDDAEIVCEAGPSMGRHHDDILRRIETFVIRYANQIHWLTPSRWKGHPASRLTRSERKQLKTPHERDAVGMARVWQTRETHNE